MILNSRYYRMAKHWGYLARVSRQELNNQGQHDRFSAIAHGLLLKAKGE